MSSQGNIKKNNITTNDTSALVDPRHTIKLDEAVIDSETAIATIPMQNNKGDNT
jgi:hypothetical protein